MALSGAVIQNGNGGLAIEVRPHTVEAFIEVTASGSYPAGGDTLDLTDLSGALGQFGVPDGQLPMWTEIHSEASGGASGYVYAYRPGTAQDDGKVQVLESAGSGAPLAELGAGAYPAGVTGDKIIGRFTFLRG